MNHSLAQIHPEALIGDNVNIGPFVCIEKNVEIGEGTWIGPNVCIMEGARIGKNCKIFPGAVISAIPQDLKYQGENTKVHIGDNTTIREFVTVNRGTQANWETRIGNNCLIMAYVHVAHDCVIGHHCIIANAVTLAGHVMIGDYVNIGGMTAVQQFISIGSHTMTSGGSLVRKDIPPFIKCAREPLAYVGINSIGLKRRGFSQEEVNRIQDIYRILFLKNNNVAQALSIIEEEIIDCQAKQEIIKFVGLSQNGLLRGLKMEDIQFKED